MDGKWHLLKESKVVALAALQIACKYDEKEYPLLKDLSKCSNSQIKIDTISKMETKIL